MLLWRIQRFTIEWMKQSRELHAMNREGGVLGLGECVGYIQKILIVETDGCFIYIKRS